MCKHHVSTTIIQYEQCRTVQRLQCDAHYDFIEGLFYAVGGGLGLTLALVLMASIREQTELVDVPRMAQGMGLVLILAGSLSLAFMGFAGLFSS